MADFVQETCTRNTNQGRTLDVIVEGAVFLSVFSQKPKSVVVSEVFELDKGVLAIPTEHSKSLSSPKNDYFTTNPARFSLDRGFKELHLHSVHI